MKSHIDAHGRECLSCKDYKTWDNFTPNKSVSTGHQASCKQCKSKYNRDNAAKHRAKVIAGMEGFSERKQAFYLGVI